MLPLILASSSVYRRALLDKLQLEYQCHSPDIDETPLPNESALSLVERLAIAKARAIAKHYPAHIIIGSDQAAICKDSILGKPGNCENAFQQLLNASGEKVTFLTGLCVINTYTGQELSLVEPFHVHFRKLTPSMIKNYLDKDQPWDCAGSFKSEGLGISLFEKLEGDDPNSLIGLPLIQLIRCLDKMEQPVL